MATVTISSLSSYSSYRDSRSPLPIEVQHANLAVSSTVYVGNLSCVPILSSSRFPADLDGLNTQFLHDRGADLRAL